MRSRKKSHGTWKRRAQATVPKALGEAGPCMALLGNFNSCLLFADEEDIEKVETKVQVLHLQQRRNSINHSRTVMATSACPKSSP